ncbi:MAG: type 4a pilus biogenesis protein PilO [Pseudomonadales bacterium]|nr:type 4a pilus biogenesis protein PilO [Pseudomonadales bacterium]MCP5185861.1 type 4a pilus biogenesis protein PilO [Pseudomonadales bacterium]
MNLPRIGGLAPREVALIGGAGLFLVVSLLVAFVGKPLYGKFRDSATELEGLRALADQPQEAGLEPLEAEVQKLSESLHGNLHNLPANQLEAHMVSALQSASWQHDVTLVTIEPVAVPVELPYQELTFRLELEGSYTDLSDWLQNVTTQLGYVVVTEYGLKVKEPGRNPALVARMQLSAYRMLDG